MKLYVTFTSPYARLARILVLEKALEDRVEIIEAKTRATDSPYYQINPSGRVPYLINDDGVGMEDSQLICAYLDSLDGKPRFHDPRRRTDWAYQHALVCGDRAGSGCLQGRFPLTRESADVATPAQSAR
jgi:glutathione S-transferase